MRIAHIDPPWLPIPPKNYGGTENVIYNLIEEQVSQGHEVTLFAPADAKTSAELISFFSRSLYEDKVPWDAHLKAYYHLHKSVAYLKKHKDDFDIVHMHLSSSSDMYVFPLAETLSLPHVATLHSQFPFDRTTTGWQGDADKYYIEWLSKMPLVAISESSRRLIQKNVFSLKLNIVAVVHHGIPVKNVRAGSSRPEDYFSEQIEPQLDGQQIKYIGPVGAKAKVDLLSRARGMLNPIQWEEPFGMVMAEAMAAGCPVIAFRRGAANEIILSEKVGFLVDDVAEMVDSIRRIDEIDREAVRHYAEMHFSAGAMAENYVIVYQRIIGLRQRHDQTLAIPAKV